MLYVGAWKEIMMKTIIRLGCLFTLLIVSCTSKILPTEAVGEAPSVEAGSEISIPTSAPINFEDPPVCSNAKMIYHTQLREMLLLGCISGSVRLNTPNVIWGYNEKGWHKVTQGGPDMRVLAGAAYDQKRNVVVQYGGQPMDSFECVRETWEWDAQTWVQKEVESPFACDHFAMVYDPTSADVILFGGQAESQVPNNETWSWNGETWTSVSKDGPGSRAHFGFVYDPTHQQVLLYGGFTGRVFNDFWVWRDNAWQEINFSSGPGTLSHFGMTYDANNDALVIFGGAGTASTFRSLSNRTWIFMDGAWSEMILEESPSTRGLPAMAYDPDRRKVLLYGGFDSDGNELDDTWEWDGNTWTCLLNCR
jgi:hypothetical protein